EVAIVRIFVASRRPCDSDAFATWSYATYDVPQPLSAETFVSAAVSVVLPWSTWPMVPTFTCGLSRLNLLLAIERPRQNVEASKRRSVHRSPQHRFRSKELATRIELVT